MNVQAILFDTRSIQRYIFSGNKLKTNIGASYIVDHVFEDVLVGTVLQHLYSGQVDSTSWQKGGSAEQALDKDGYVAYVSYIGGGNALILFRNQTRQQLKAVVTAFTTTLLVRYPGLRTGSAITASFVTETFDASLKGLYAILKENQNTVFPQVNVPYTGLTLTCDVNGEAANYYDTGHVIGAERRYYSQEVYQKAKAAAAANEELKQKFQDVTGDTYTFPEELGNLGQKEGENYIAVVHIDGNQMGQKFSQCKTSAERSALSRRVKAKTEQSFSYLVRDIVEEYSRYRDFLAVDTEQGKKNLPIRPLILGGDDVTFVCAARMAVTYAQRFMYYMNRPVDDDKTENLTIQTCGGIAILPTAYPFFRGYELAEQVCDAAKEQSRQTPLAYTNTTEEGLPTTCWLDFCILHGEQAPELSQIRKQEYSGVLGDLHMGPYQVNTKDDAGHIDHCTDVPQKADHRYDLDNLLACTKYFIDALPHGKVKEMRSVIARGEHDISQYMEQFRDQNLQLPDIPAWQGRYHAMLWDGKPGSQRQTPFVDAIELMDFIDYIRQDDAAAAKEEG